MLRRFEHRPAHLYRSLAVYFISARTVQGLPLFGSPEKREVLLDVLDRVTRDAQRALYAWFVGAEHYHVLLGCAADVPLDPLKGASSAESGVRFDLGRWANRVHAATATLMNRTDGTPGRKVFSQYWDRCMRSEGELYATLNYIHQNPVKHGLTETLQGARSYPYCSLGRFFAHYGEEWVGECFTRYPIIDYTSPYKEEDGDTTTP